MPIKYILLRTILASGIISSFEEGYNSEKKKKAKSYKWNISGIGSEETSTQEAVAGESGV